MKHNSINNISKSIALAIILIFSVNCLKAQKSVTEFKFKEPIIIKAVKNVNDSIKIGDTFKLYSVVSFKPSDSKPEGYLGIQLRKPNEPFRQSSNIPLKQFNKFEIQNLDNTDYTWNSILLNTDYYSSIIDKGMQYDIRNQLEEDNREYLNKLEEKGVFFKDDYFEDYLYSILSKIHFGVLSDGRPGNITVKIIKNAEPQAFCLGNGAVIISTGLLSSIESEDELVAVLAHEVAHFVLDHQILNYNAIADRKKRAEFWSTFAVVAAATADVLMAANNKNHPVGILTLNAAIAATIISNEVLEKLGIKYNKKQEEDADWASRAISSALKYDADGLSVALQRIKNHFVQTGNNKALTGDDSHPDIDSRIGYDLQKIDKSKFSQPNYLKKVSFINSFNAKNELWSYSHLDKAIELADKNISNGVGTELDYIIKSIVLRRLYNSKSRNEESLALLQKAKTILVTENLIVHREEGIALLRLNRNLEARKSFETYLAALISYQKVVDSDANRFNDSDSELLYEIEWAKKMIFKSGQL